MSKNYGIDAQGNKADITRGDLVHFWPDTLIPMRNYRFGSFDTDPEVKAAREKEIEDMVLSLIAENQKQPISIHEVSGSRFQVHSGDTRHQAALRIDERRIWPWGKPEDQGRMRIECRVENFAKDSAKEVFGSSIVENLARNNLSIVDVCIAVAEAERLGYTDADIMAKFRQSDPAWLPNMRRLARLSDIRKREIHLGHMAASVGYLLAEIPEESHAEVLAEAAGISHPDGTVHPYIGGDVEAERSTQPWENDCDPAFAAAILSEPAADTSLAPISENAVFGNAVVVNRRKTSIYREDPAPTQAMPAPTTAPVGKTRGRPKKVTARAVAKAAKVRGLLKHKKIQQTVASMKEFWTPFVEDRNKGTRLYRLAEAQISWMSDQIDDDRFYAEILAILKEIPK